MKELWVAPAVVGLLSLCAAAQTGTNNQPNNAKTPNADTAMPILTRGDFLSVTLSKSLDAAKARVGDPVLAEVSPDDPPLGQLHKRTMVARVVGHISDVQSRKGNKPESRLTIVFDKAFLRDGAEMPFTAVITGVAPPYKPPRQPQQNIPKIEQGGPSAQDHAAGPVRTATGTGPAHRTPTVLETEVDRAHSSQSGPGPDTGIKDVYLKYNPSGSTLMSPKHNVKVERGALLVLRFMGP